MVAQTSINRALNFGTVLEGWVRDARADIRVFATLQKLAMIRYTGTEISEADTKWKLAQGVKISSIFTSSEVGLILYSIPDGSPEGRYLRQVPNNPLIFRRVDITMPGRNGNSKMDLYEIVVPASSPHAPSPFFRNADGNFSTGDLVELIAPGLALEESFKTLSSNIISKAIVVGPGRPYLTLIVEPISDVVVLLTAEEQYKIKLQITVNQAEENVQCMNYASITDLERIVFVQRGRLPRTVVKGSIQRRELEKVFKDELE